MTKQWLLRALIEGHIQPADQICRLCMGLPKALCRSWSQRSGSCRNGWRNAHRGTYLSANVSILATFLATCLAPCRSVGHQAWRIWLFKFVHSTACGSSRMESLVVQMVIPEQITAAPQRYVRTTLPCTVLMPTRSTDAELSARIIPVRAGELIRLNGVVTDRC